MPRRLPAGPPRLPASQEARLDELYNTPVCAGKLTPEGNDDMIREACLACPEDQRPPAAEGYLQYHAFNDKWVKIIDAHELTKELARQCMGEYMALMYKWPWLPNSVYIMHIVHRYLTVPVPLPECSARALAQRGAWGESTDQVMSDLAALVLLKVQNDKPGTVLAAKRLWDEMCCGDGSGDGNGGLLWASQADAALRAAGSSSAQAATFLVTQALKVLHLLMSHARYGDAGLSLAAADRLWLAMARRLVALDDQRPENWMWLARSEMVRGQSREAWRLLEHVRELAEASNDGLQLAAVCLAKAACLDDGAKGARYVVGELYDLCDEAKRYERQLKKYNLGSFVKMHSSSEYDELHGIRERLQNSAGVPRTQTFPASDRSRRATPQQVLAEHNQMKAVLRAVAPQAAGEGLLLDVVSMSRRNVGKVCACCGETFLVTMACGSCKLARYCGKVCQTKHWPEHKAACKAARKAPKAAAETAAASASA